MIADRTATLPRTGLLAAGMGAAMALRLAVSGNDGLHSPGAGLAFGGALFVLACAAGWRPGRVSAASLALGVLGGTLLIALPAWLRLSGGVPDMSFPADSFPLWSSIVVVVAVAEEIVLRGVLFAAILPRMGTLGAVAVTSAAFALVHVPLYGWAAVPLDFAAGVWLGALRAASGGVTAPATAHVLADLATWWLF